MSRLDTQLRDDDTATGGVSYAGQTLREFLDEVELPYDTPLPQINQVLKENGIKEI